MLPFEVNSCVLDDIQATVIQFMTEYYRKLTMFTDNTEKTAIIRSHDSAHDLELFPFSCIFSLKLNAI